MEKDLEALTSKMNSGDTLCSIRFWSFPRILYSLGVKYIICDFPNPEYFGICYFGGVRGGGGRSYFVEVSKL